MHRDNATWFCLSSDICATVHLLYLWLCGCAHCNFALYELDSLSLPLGADFILLLSQKHFSCAEANLGAGADSLPLLVMAISETLLPWPAYAKHYSEFAEAPHGETLQGHFNPGVQAAAAEVSGMTTLFLRKKLLSIWLLDIAER